MSDITITRMAVLWFSRAYNDCLSGSVDRSFVFSYNTAF